jgi:uncharacterized membrane protein
MNSGHTFFICALGALIATGVFAQERPVPILPSIFKVSGLQEGDHLNVRSGPSAQAADIGDLKPGTLVEVTAMDTNVGWSQIVYGEWTAWVYARFLEEVETPLMVGTDLPANMSCGGTEPFWSLTVDNGSTVEFQLMGEVSETESIAYSGKSANHILRQGLQTTNWIAFLEKSQCSDGMSDRRMGISIELMSKGSVPKHYSGCCSLTLDVSG